MWEETHLSLIVGWKRELLFPLFVSVNVMDLSLSREDCNHRQMTAGDGHPLTANQEGELGKEDGWTGGWFHWSWSAAVELLMSHQQLPCDHQNCVSGGQRVTEPCSDSWSGIGTPQPASQVVCSFLKWSNPVKKTKQKKNGQLCWSVFKFLPVWAPGHTTAHGTSSRFWHICPFQF